MNKRKIKKWGLWCQQKKLVFPKQLHGLRKLGLIDIMEKFLNFVQNLLTVKIAYADM